MFRWGGVCVDCGDGDFDAMVRFYTGLLGLEVDEGSCEPKECTHDGTSHWATLVDPRGGLTVNIQSESWYERPVWPEQAGPPAKMMHFEVGVDDVPAGVAVALGLGARKASPQPPRRDPVQIRVMLDPAGHPFCLSNDDLCE